MKKQKNREIIIDGDFILGVLIICILIAYHLNFLFINWYVLGYWTFHLTALFSAIQIIVKIIKFIYNKIKNKRSDV
nr:MAG TPA: hypothetical protein [Ackermannviridae sp.]